MTGWPSWLGTSRKEGHVGSSPPPVTKANATKPDPSGRAFSLEIRVSILLDGKLAFEDQRLLRILYGQSHRAYHNESHANHVFAYMGVIKSRYANKLPDFCVKPGFRLNVSAWHDAYYDIGSQTNEMRSAQLYRDSVTAEAHTSEMRSEIAAAIDASANHWDPLNEALSPQSLVFLDADLYELGSHYEIFRHNALNIITEYSSLYDRDVVVSGRRQWYETLLDRDRIYWIATDRDDAVRQNVERALKDTY